MKGVIYKLPLWSYAGVGIISSLITWVTTSIKSDFEIRILKLEKEELKKS